MRFHLMTSLFAMIIGLTLLSGCSGHDVKLPTGDTRTYGNGEPIKKENHGAALQPQQQRGAYGHSAVLTADSNKDSFYQGPYSQPFYTGPYTSEKPALYETPAYRDHVKLKFGDVSRERPHYGNPNSRPLNETPRFGPILKR